MSAVFCPSCGSTSPAGSGFCTGCGRALKAPSRSGGWRPPDAPREGQPRPSAPPPPRNDPPPAPGRAGPPTGVAGLRGARVVEGRVDGVTTRVETNQQPAETIWSFRLERYDEAGNRVQLVPVEMRGIGFEGSLSDGDTVRAHGRARGGTFRATKVENLTTGAEVVPKQVPAVVKVILYIFAALVVAFIAAIAISIFTADTGFPDPPAPWDEEGMAEEASGYGGASWAMSEVT